MALKNERDSRGLTPVQAAFVDGFTGNVAETARLIGAGEGYCSNLMCKPEYAHVRRCLFDKVRAERAALSGNVVASRLERLAFWTEIMREASVETKDRLKASELLGRAHMDFVEKTVLETAGPIQVGVVKGLDERIKQIQNMEWLE